MIFVYACVGGECVLLCTPAQIVKKHGTVSILTPQNGMGWFVGNRRETEFEYGY